MATPELATGVRGAQRLRRSCARFPTLPRGSGLPADVVDDRGAGDRVARLAPAVTGLGGIFRGGFPCRIWGLATHHRREASVVCGSSRGLPALIRRRHLPRLRGPLAGLVQSSRHCRRRHPAALDKPNRARRAVGQPGELFLGDSGGESPLPERMLRSRGYVVVSVMAGRAWAATARRSKQLRPEIVCTGTRQPATRSDRTRSS
jgi:hypothetical protein